MGFVRDGPLGAIDKTRGIVIKPGSRFSEHFTYSGVLEYVYSSAEITFEFEVTEISRQAYVNDRSLKTSLAHAFTKSDNLSLDQGEFEKVKAQITEALSVLNYSQINFIESWGDLRHSKQKNVENDIVYGPKPLSYKTVSFLALFGLLGVYNLYSGLTAYTMSSDDQIPIKDIFLGGVASSLFGLALAYYIIQKFQGRPRLTLSSNQITLELGPWLRPRLANWSSLGPFQLRSLPTRRRKTLFIQSNVLGPHVSEAVKRKSTFVIPAAWLNIDTNFLLKELNRRRASALSK
jgi:hypothetical protein